MPTRVEAQMPESDTPTKNTKRLFLVAFLMFFGLGSAQGVVAGVRWMFSNHDQSLALPMSGVCEDIPVGKYTGNGDKDAQECNWRGKNYWCLYDPNKSLWGCDFIEPDSDLAKRLTVWNKH